MENKLMFSEKQFCESVVDRQVVVRDHGSHIHVFSTCFMVQSPIGDKYHFVKMVKGMRNKGREEYMMCPGCYNIYKELFNAGIINIWINASFSAKNK